MERYTWSSLLLLFFQLQSSSSLVYNTHTLEAPHDLDVTDPGYLGLLLVKWSAPYGALMDPACRVRFYLTYFNTYLNRWSVIRTPSTSHRIQVDLSKELKVRVHSLLNGPCTKYTEVKSTRYAEVVRSPGRGSAVVQRLGCVFHRMEHTECTWEQANHTSLHRLYYWYVDSGATQECPKYIFHDGVRRGCRFTRGQLPVSSLVSICVNSSSPTRASEPAYLYLKIHNHVKPAATEELSLEVVSDVEPRLQLEWTQPVGRVPGHCLQWEVEHSSDRSNGSQPRKKGTLTTETSLRMPLPSDTERFCYRVRSKLADCCAKHGIWSDWSHSECYFPTKR
ncbi:interleukin-13 receptor subunit alpha-2 isoform X1 [Gadus macrocephalus]|uniref:interleukin-13 receptor subunit alpha-2 isoform X1 n=1 Tax=Gadus macrocephalus TaxID=80720 RepID=UPI0028CB1BED|nr:interleukin-13 receptor subunit alpha-2 isoform X1 [Gadus macrocephalus]